MRSVLGVHWKDWCWSWNSSTLATSCEELTHWKSLWCWEGLGAGGEGDDRGWDGWWHHWLNGHEFEWTPWWWTGRLGMLHKESDTNERLNWTEDSPKEQVPYWENNLVILPNSLLLCVNICIYMVYHHMFKDIWIRNFIYIWLSIIYSWVLFTSSYQIQEE